MGCTPQLTPSPDGTWTETVLYSFTGGSDGSQPLGGLAIDSVGNLYGTTASGGENNDSCGTLFVLWQGIKWQIEVLHTFDDRTGDGCQPQADLNFVDSYYLLGTTVGGGPTGQGTVFSSESGDYHIWPFQGKNGDFPNGLGLFGDGSVYGTTYYGDNVFELSPPIIVVKYVFSSTGKAGYGPVGDLATQVNANGVRIMYGVNRFGGVGRYGTVYQLTESQSYQDVWAISVLHSFSGRDGATPFAGVVLDPAGNLYGTTAEGAQNQGPLARFSI